ncbi:EAL domain-containing protein [Micromonospora sp. WMMD1082]|uniref:EAL domain-containing protein n=1 Tax=Micromonospora sp. WMMD1082 TaxID=3016104 RepID=UPI002416560B|nr:EAL domain-containing protein [Micromonospora sp. WMMD1082]MDG4794996.1 EAL domain-containing protein [Micromonospora sp. WMMD1082]
MACLGWAITHLGSPTPQQQVYLWMGAALMAMGAAFSVPLPPRLSVRVTLTPTACLVCASVLPAPWVVVCAAIGVGAARLLVRRPLSWHRAAHNTSMDVIAAALAAGVMASFGVRPVAGEPAWTTAPYSRHLLAFVVAAVVVVVCEELVTAAAVTLSTRRPLLVVLRGLWLTRLCVAVAEISVAGAAVLVTGLDMRALAALPLVMLVLHLALTYRLRVAEERRVWERLAALSDALASRDLDVVVQTAAAGAVDLFGAAAADVEFAEGVRLVRAVRRGGGAELVYDGPAADAPDVADARHAVSYAFGGGDADGVCGVLRLHLNKPRDTLSVRERAALQTFAATLTSSLDLAYAYGRLAAQSRRHETAASHDEDTGLWNRAGLLHRLGEGFGDRCHVVVVRVDNYALVTDVLTSDRAVAVLNTLAGRLRHATMDLTAEVAKVGDATFAMAIADLPAEVAYQKACWAVAALRREVEVDGRRLTMRACAAMVSGQPGENLINAAELVLGRASRNGDDRLVSRQDGPVHPWSLVRELTSARMSISFEPIIDLVSGRITLMQSVPRWLRSRDEVLTADEYVYQLIDDNDVGSLEVVATTLVTRSLAAAATWQVALPDTALVVPVPAKAFTQAFAESVRDLLSEHTGPGPSLVLALAGPPAAKARDTAEWIGQFGVRLLLDNYGSAGVDLETVSAVAGGFLRLHPAFSLDAGYQPARSVIRAAVDLAKDLDLAVVAPGIRTYRQRQELAEIGCALGSGPLVGGELFPSQVRRMADLWRFQPLHGIEGVSLHHGRRTVGSRPGA